MKVLLVNATLTGGAAIACKRLKKSLDNQPIDIKIFTSQSLIATSSNFFTNLLLKYKIFAKFLIERLYFITLEKLKKYRFAFSIANTGFELAQNKSFKDADIIHLHWVNHGFISLQGLNNLFCLNKPVVWTLHDMWAFTGGCHYSGTCTHYMNQCGNCMMLKNANINDLSHNLWLKKKNLFSNRENQITFIACSNWMKDKAMQSDLLNTFNIEHISNAINTEVFQPLDSQKCRFDFKLPQHKTLILFGAANIHDYRKGYQLLISALHIFAKNQPNSIEQIEFVVFGKSKTDIVPDFLPFTAHHVGTISNEQDMVKLYNTCDCFITTSIEDNLPNTIMESLSCGIPVIAFDIGGIPEMIDHLQNGYLANSQNLNSLVDAFLWASSNISDTVKYNARRKVLDNYTEAIISQKHLELYHTVLKTSKL